jgi:glycosyltransferase involved in cell wall biosynthesis
VKILLAHNRYRSPGGEERHVGLLLNGLRDAGLQTMVFERESALVDRSHLNRIRGGIMLTYNPRAGGIRDVLSGWRPDIVHFHNIWPLLTPAALRLAKQSGAAVVLTLHNCRFACPGGTCPVRRHDANAGPLDNPCPSRPSLRCAIAHNPRGRQLESLAYGTALELQRRLHMLERWVDAFIVPSRYIAHMLRSAGIADNRVDLIPHGVPVSPIDTHDQRRFALFIGRVSAEKGIRTLLQAATIAPEVPLAVAGAGPLVQDVRASQIEYLGQLEHRLVAETLSHAAFTIIPSECHEAFPYAALESIAAGRPVVATNVGGLPEIVRDGETGLIVPACTAEALAQAMRQLWADPNLTERLGAQASRQVRDEYSLDLQLERTIALYRDLVIGAAAFNPRIGTARGAITCDIAAGEGA